MSLGVAPPGLLISARIVSTVGNGGGSAAESVGAVEFGRDIDVPAAV